MKGLGQITIVCVGALALAGCGTQLEKAERISPEGSAFDVALYQGYLGLAKSETGEGDYRDSDAFALRAVSAGTGGKVGPEAIDARGLPADKVGELSNARARLMAALGAGAAQKMPAESADAQVKFDCWMQEQEENFQPDDIAACKGGFYDALAKLESGAKPMAEAPPPAPEPKLEALSYVVYFETDSAELDAAAKAVLAEAQAAAAKAAGAKISVSGHTDTVGQSGYNETLSRMRAEAVAKAMAAGGVPAEAISMAAYGQTRLAKPTGDNVGLRENRRVEIVVEQ